MSIPDDLETIEITGTHSKTSTALLLAMILSGQKRVLSHTTRGLEIWDCGTPRLLKRGLSITPANVILALQEALTQKAGALICEISLGGTGLAKYGVLTSLSGDYRIADGTKWASTAKLQMPLWREGHIWRQTLTVGFLLISPLGRGEASVPLPLS